MTNRFFFRDKFFDNEKEYFQYVRDYNDSKISQQSFEYIMYLMKKDIWINHELIPSNITNLKLQEIISKYTLEIVMEMRKSDEEQ